MASSADEVNWLRTEIIPKLLTDQKLIAGIEQNGIDKFQVKDVAVQFIGSKEAFMLTSCYRACVTYEFKGAVGKINFFVKKTPQLPQEMFDMINFKSLFTNEILGYEKIVPALETFGNIKLNTARFYYAKLQSNFATIITEDFGSNGWRVTKDRFNLSLEHVLLAVKYLAQFHAAGFALRATDRTSFEELTQNLLESRYASEVLHHQWSLEMKISVKRTVKAAREHHNDIPEEFLQKYAEFENTFHQYCKQMVQPAEPMVTLCHGDYLRNNVAYKYDDDDDDDDDGESGDSPREIMMFDLQTLRVSSPMVDLTTFMALSTLAEVRHKNFHLIFGTYCEHLKQTYEDIVQQALPEYLSYDCLLREYIKFLPYGVITAASFLGVLIAPLEISIEEMLLQQLSDDDIIQDAMSRGGERLDHELAHQMKEMYDLSREHNVDVLGKELWEK